MLKVVVDNEADIKNMRRFVVLITSAFAAFVMKFEVNHSMQLIQSAINEGPCRHSSRWFGGGYVIWSNQLTLKLSVWPCLQHFADFEAWVLIVWSILVKFEADCLKICLFFQQLQFIKSEEVWVLIWSCFVKGCSRTWSSDQEHLQVLSKTIL